MSERLDKALRDAKKSLQPKEPDWDAVDAKLFARIEADDKVRVARIGSSSRAWAWACGGLAIAAAAAMFIGKRPAPGAPGALEALAPSAGSSAKASALVTRSGAGEVFVAGASASSGADVRAGDAIETRGAIAFFERPGAVSWDVEDQSKLTVTKANASLVLSLERGAVEAQVKPVASGEAFAVDVAAADGKVTRIAVHGTHLRVARAGARVTVDLNEGVISIGAPPRTGSTQGTLVTAPAHVELDAQDPSGTLVVSHAPGDVKAARDLPAPSSSAPTAAMPQSAVAKQPPAPPAPPAVAPVARPAAPHPPPEPAVDPNAPETITRAVKACMGAHTVSGDPQVKVSVSTTLELHLTERGMPDFARFDPPLPQPAQECASAAIYKTRFTSGGTVRIRLDF
jgi:hypothetical protein